ncbi:type VI secretion system accessory protein TagJ [Rhodoferax aquaticus]|uniref:ImpE protein superfamily protein n=1 Tax=Rhodoferax aquaticus TaxID=2527691 RepID=A0A515EPW2_9BURK|nr:type VI secretion system accessory protein TagJ [Rhodoferax aquaticus]QDL54679.1 ImpE protein superfamily protein [Rhodoferax aquaticus]
MTAQTAPTPSLTLSQLHPDHHLGQALALLEKGVRFKPTQVQARWALVEFLCLLGHWERALKQLQTAMQLATVDEENGPGWLHTAYLLRGLIRAQDQRSAVFAGEQQPVPVIDTTPWMQDLAQAIAHNARGDHARADVLRCRALEQAPTQAGICTQDNESGEQTHTWLSDSDTRLGPVCELIIAGGYRWLAYADIACLHIQRPSSVLDLVWLPVTLQLRGTLAADKTLHAYIPTRYHGTEDKAADYTDPQARTLLLSRLTLWHEVGDTGVFAHGQKTLMTEHGDMPLLDLRELRQPLSEASA